MTNENNRRVTRSSKQPKEADEAADHSPMDNDPTSEEPTAPHHQESSQSRDTHGDSERDDTNEGNEDSKNHSPSNDDLNSGEENQDANAKLTSDYADEN